jgi:ribose 5-phosphate isomerase B
MKISIGSDERTHLIGTVISALKKRGHNLILHGPLNGHDQQWPGVAQAVAEDVAEGRADQGILFCWTGTGVSITANKVPGIRAALCHDAETARGARQWNDANILVMSLRATPEIIAEEMLDAWFSAPPGDASDAACIAGVASIEKKYMQNS